MKSMYILPRFVALFCATFLFVVICIATTSGLIGMMSGYGLIDTYKAAAIFPPTVVLGVIAGFVQSISCTIEEE